MPSTSRVALGFDFGTESVRALLVDMQGAERGSAVANYKHGQITDVLPTGGPRLPAFYALQHPQDWLDSSAKAVRAALRQAKLEPHEVVGIGVSFTSCTMLPTLRDGTPLCQLKRFAKEPLAWPKLWKHHGAKDQTDRINRVAKQRKESFLNHYGGIIGLEWFFPKVLETLEDAPSVFAAAEVWLEAGDWMVWQLVRADADQLPRSTCQAGYKAMWSNEAGYPSTAFLKAVHPGLAHVVRDKMPGRLLAPGQSAGELSTGPAKRLGLRAGVPVSAAVIDAHAGVPGAGAAEPGTLVMVMGTSSCHMLNAIENRYVPGVAGIVEGGILPGLVGYETGQAAVGDAFDWLRRLLGQNEFSALDIAAGSIPPGSDGVRCIDWFNGCRTPLMNGHLRGSFSGLTLQHRPEHLYRAILEASACGVRWIVEVLREGGVPVDRFVATGGLPHHNPLLVQIYADVLGERISVHPSRHGSALGAAILGALAAGPAQTGFRSAASAIRAMALPPRAKKRESLVVRPNRRHREVYNSAYEEYRRLAEFFQRNHGA
ncbi:MAG: ribulokinase [Pirellulales bacterium]